MMEFTKEQLSAINKDGNIIVSAGAGSGKTTVLSERVIRKVKEGIHINNLLILTFTKAAAYEMKDRIRKKLYDNNFKDELLYIDSAYITTFDSYTYSIVKKYYYLLDINPNIQIIDNLDVEKKKIVDSIFEENYKDNDKFKSFIDDLCVKDDKQIKEYLLVLADKVSLNINYLEYLDTYIDKYYSIEFINQNIDEYIKLIKDEINKTIELLNEIKCIDAVYYEKIEKIFNPIILCKNYNDIANNIDITIPRLPNKSSLELKELKERLSDILNNTKSMIKYNDINLYKEEILSTKKYSEVLIYLLKEYYKRLNDYKKSINRYEFTDIAHMAIKVIQENDSIKEQIKNSFNEIMIDEYQDTNDIQEYFISLISNNNIYMVGDIKQSIYRFRNANPTIFKNKYDLYKNNKDGIKIDLNKNFRSRDILLDDINNIFSELMDNNYGQADYKKEHKLIFGNNKYNLKNENQIYDIEVLKYRENNDYTKEEQEAFLLADDILDKMNNGYKVLDSSGLRNVKYEDFAILVDRGTNFDLIKKVFEYKKIPLTILKDENINQSDEIYIFKNLLTLLIKYNKEEIDIEFKYALISILRSYLMGYSDSKIFEIYSEALFEENEVIEKIKKINMLSINSVLNSLINEFDIYTKLVNVGDIDVRSNLIKYILNLGSEKSNIGYTIEEFANYLNDLLDLHKDIKYNVENSKDGVKLMTIYKSKGLEFPICYMPYLYKKFNISDLNGLILYDDKLGIICPYKNDKIDNTFYKTIMKKQYIKDEISEEIRLFYVGLTRAKEKLILVNYEEEKEKFIYKENYRSFKNFIDSLNINLKTKYVNPNIESNYNIIKDIEKLNLKENIINIKDIQIEKQELDEYNYSTSSAKLITKEEYENKEYGINLHKRLENFDFKDDIVKRFLNHNEILNINDANIYHEYEFLYNSSIGIIDLMLEYKDEIIIVDYKTENISKKEYFDQVKRYMEYIKYISNKKVRGYLYSIINDKFVEVL